MTEAAMWARRAEPAASQWEGREQGPGREAGRTWGRETWSRRHRQDFGFDPEVSEQLRRRQT